MSVRFSRVMAIANGKVAIFLVSGIPKTQNDLDCWKDFKAFTEELKENERITVNIETFEYGEGEPNDATPEEVAYFYIRENRRPDFIESRTKRIGKSNFVMPLKK